MAKFTFQYIETYKKTYVVEADTYDEAEEKMEQAAESGDVNTGCDDFDHWDVMPGDYGRYPIPRDQEKLYRNHDAIN